MQIQLYILGTSEQQLHTVEQQNIRMWLKLILKINHWQRQRHHHCDEIHHSVIENVENLYKNDRNQVIKVI